MVFRISHGNIKNYQQNDWKHTWRYLSLRSNSNIRPVVHTTPSRCAPEPSRCAYAASRCAHAASRYAHAASRCARNALLLCTSTLLLCTHTHTLSLCIRPRPVVHKIPSRCAHETLLLCTTCSAFVHKIPNRAQTNQRQQHQSTSNRPLMHSTQTHQPSFKTCTRNPSRPSAEIPK